MPTVHCFWCIQTKHSAITSGVIFLIRSAMTDPNGICYNTGTMAYTRTKKIRHLCRLLGMAVLCALIVVSFQPKIANAQIGSCSVSFSPQTVNTGSDTQFSFSLYTNDGSQINWMQVTRPSGDYVSLESASASNWQADVGNDAITFTGGNVQS